VLGKAWKNNDVRAIAAFSLLLGFGFSLVTITGCGQSSESQGVTSPTALEQAIRSLDQGMSAEEVRARLGEPLAEPGKDPSESSLQYPGWLLLFNEQGLERRIRQRSPGGPTGRLLGTALNSAVLRLAPGMPIRTVRSRLGRPQIVEEVFRSSSPPEIILRYGPWELAFANRALRQRTMQ